MDKGLETNPRVQIEDDTVWTKDWRQHPPVHIEHDTIWIKDGRKHPLVLDQCIKSVCQTQDNSIFIWTIGVIISCEMNISNISALV